MEGGHRGADVYEELWPESYLLILLTVVLGNTAIFFPVSGHGASVVCIVSNAK